MGVQPVGSPLTIIPAVALPPYRCTGNPMSTARSGPAAATATPAGATTADATIVGTGTAPEVFGYGVT
ncbi:hypothetical protein [Saccharothrix deserti]|uniref:hypothetical protein n=1 Tax=Saccharothrix deserti TaxID=2593674 RepID=UPI00131D19BA|nr:hypothetical protein [Saccharothrix deserti]